MEITVTAKEKMALDARYVPERPCRGVLEAAGLSVEEVGLVELFYKCPTPAGVPDSVRCAVWALNCLPGTGEGLSPTTYYATSRERDPPAGQIKRYLEAAEHAFQGEKGEEPRLFRVLRKLLAWCQEYEKQHVYSPEYGQATRRKTRKKTERPGSELVVVESPASPELTVQVIGEQLELL